MVLLLGLLVLFCTENGAASFRIGNGNTVVDSGGRTLRVEKPFVRIISLYGAHTENLFALGLNTEIVGVTRHETYPPEALAKPDFSYHDDPEKYLAAGPDLVLIRPMIDRGYPQLIARLEKSGIAVMSLQPKGMEDLFRYWRILGLLTGREQRAEEMIEGFRKTVSTYEALAAGIAQKKRVYFEAIHTKMKTFSPRSMTIFVLSTAGGINVASDAVPRRESNIAVFGKERILSRADEIDVYLAQVGTMNPTSIAAIRNEPGFSAIRAVRNGEIYLIDEMIVSRPTLRLLEGIRRIGNILYPEVFAAAGDRN